MAKNNENIPQEEMEPDLMTLQDEDGNEIVFEVIDALDHNDTRYMAVVEFFEEDDDSEEAALVIVKVGEDEEGEFIDIVTDDEELLAVSKLFEKRLVGDFTIEE